MDRHQKAEGRQIGGGARTWRLSSESAWDRTDADVSVVTARRASLPAPPLLLLVLVGFTARRLRLLGGCVLTGGCPARRWLSREPGVLRLSALYCRIHGGSQESVLHLIGPTFWVRWFI